MYPTGTVHIFGIKSSRCVIPDYNPALCQILSISAKPFAREEVKNIHIHKLSPL